MYKDFFGMKNTPFVRGIPVNALYSDSETDEINARLLSAAKDQSFALLVGDSGIGKTTAIRRMRNGLSESEYTVLYLADSNLTPRALYSELLEQLGCPTKSQRIAALRLRSCAVWDSTNWLSSWMKAIFWTERCWKKSAFS